jgi:hypothetical protein
MDGKFKSPSPVIMAGNLIATGKDVIKEFVQTRNVFAPEDLWRGRLEICSNCDKFNQENKRCTMCGCYMATKVRILAAKCPADIW